MSRDMVSSAEKDLEQDMPRSFLSRYRLPLFLAVVAIVLYASSILYFIYGKGQLA